jgi:hypothetical protein
MFATHPKMAKRWAAHTPKGKKLPHKVHETPLEPKLGLMMGEEPADDVNMALPDPEATGHEFQKKANIFAIRMPDIFKVRTLEGEVEGKAGDFLCKGKEDELWPIDAEIFLKTYAPVPPKMEKVFKSR